ncbi:MAG: DMT family transporter [bacterium]|nr:DMT family transporter [bacterium]
MKNNYTRGVAMALGTALLWGGMSPLAKFVGSQGVSMASVMCYRALLVVILMAAWLRSSLGAGWYRIERRLMRTYLLLGFLTVVMNACGFMMSCAYLTVPQALMIHYTFPLATMAGSYFITREKPPLLQVAAGLIIIVGLYVGFMGAGGRMNSVSPAGLLWAVASVIGLSGQTLVSRRILKGGATDPLIQLFYIHLFGGAMLIVGKSALMGWTDLKAIDGAVFALMQYSALGAGLLGFGFMFNALKFIPASLVSLICTLELVFALCITPFALGLYPTANELLGCAVIMVSVACASVRSAK